MAGVCGVGFEECGVVLDSTIRELLMDGEEAAAAPNSRAKLVLRDWLRPEVKSVEEFVDYLKSSGPSGAWYSEAGCVRR
jgi:hypothetical protein